MAKPFTKFDGGGYPGLADDPGTRDGTKFLRDDGTWQNPGPSSIPGLNARFWLSDADAALPNGVDMSLLADGILRHAVSGGISTPGIVTIGSSLSFLAGVLDRAALTGDITAALGSNATAFRSFAALSVLARAAGTAGIPTELTATADGQVLARIGGALVWSSAFVPAARTVQGTTPIAIDGVHTAVDLSANRVWSIIANGITDALIRQSVGVSVIGRSANSTGNVADIVAASDGQILRRLGGVVGFGDVPVANVTGAVPDSRTLSATSPIRIDGGASASLVANRTLSILDFTGAGGAGAVPDPTTETDRFLRDDGAWAKPPGDFVLHLGYGPDNFSGTLPVVAEAVPHFWLHPFTSIDNVSALGSGSSHNDMIIEWEVGETFTDAFLDVYVRTSSLSDAGTTATVEITKNGSDTGVAVTIPDSETSTRHQDDDTVAFADGDRVGVHVTLSGDYTTGSLIMSVTVRLK